jgi:hypothetical protein
LYISKGNRVLFFYNSCNKVTQKYWGSIVGGVLLSLEFYGRHTITNCRHWPERIWTFRPGSGWPEHRHWPECPAPLFYDNKHHFIQHVVDTEKEKKIKKTQKTKRY